MINSHNIVSSDPLAFFESSPALASPMWKACFCSPVCQKPGLFPPSKCGEMNNGAPQRKPETSTLGKIFHR